MESVYLGQNNFSRDWCSKKTDLNSYFSDYSKSYRKIMEKNKTIKDILNAILPDNVLLTNKDVQHLGSITNENELKFFNTKMKTRNLHTKKEAPYKRRNIENNNEDINQAEEEVFSCLIPGALETQEAATNVSNLLSRNEQNDSGDALNRLTDNLTDNELDIFDLSSLTENEFFHNSSVNKQNQIERENGDLISPTVDRLKKLYKNDASNNFFQNNINIDSMPSTSKNYIRQDYFSEEMQNDKSDSPLNSSNQFPQANLFKQISQINKPKNLLNFNRCQVKLENPKTKIKNFGKGEKFLVSFRIHQPFFHKDESKLEKMKQEILLLSTNTLENLRDKIICQSDYQDVQGDLSECPAVTTKFMSRDIYPSAMFYLDNTFYIDRRYVNCTDYSSVIRSWALPRGIPVGETRDMSTQLIRQLKLRFGYPYVFIHQGCCEHLVIINDARLVTGKDPLKYQAYPLMSSLSRNFIHNCGTCSTQPASWLVEDHERMLLNVNYMCKTCLTRFYYKDGKKIGNFRAFRFYQGAAIL